MTETTNEIEAVARAIDPLVWENADRRLSRLGGRNADEIREDISEVHNSESVQKSLRSARTAITALDAHRASQAGEVDREIAETFLAAAKEAFCVLEICAECFTDEEEETKDIRHAILVLQNARNKLMRFAKGDIPRGNQQ